MSLEILSFLAQQSSLLRHSLHGVINIQFFFNAAAAFFDLFPGPAVVIKYKIVYFTRRSFLQGLTIFSIPSISMFLGTASALLFMFCF
jgi:hypothetical protein